MYRMTDQFKEKSKDYRNKDLVLQALERENARCQFEAVREAFLIEELDKKGVVVFQEEVSLPFEGVAEDLFLQPKEPKKEKSKKSSFFNENFERQDIVDLIARLKSSKHIVKEFSAKRSKHTIAQIKLDPTTGLIVVDNKATTYPLIKY